MSMRATRGPHSMQKSPPANVPRHLGQIFIMTAPTIYGEQARRASRSRIASPTMSSTRRLDRRAMLHALGAMTLPLGVSCRVIAGERPRLVIEESAVE